MLQSGGSGDLSYTMRISRKKCAPGILFIIFVFVHFNWTFSSSSTTKENIEVSSADVVMRHYFAAESTRRLFSIDELDVVIKAMRDSSNEENGDKTLSVVIPCRQDQSVEREYYRQMIEHFSDVVDFAINVTFVTFVNGVEHLQRSSELDLVIVLNEWKADYTDIYCKCQTIQRLVCSALKISTHLIV